MFNGSSAKKLLNLISIQHFNIPADRFYSRGQVKQAQIMIKYKLTRYEKFWYQLTRNLCEKLLRFERLNWSVFSSKFVSINYENFD